MTRSLSGCFGRSNCFGYPTTCKRTVITLFAILFVAQAHLYAEDSWIGQKVLLKNGAKPRVGSREVPYSQIDALSTVEMVNGKSLWLGLAWIEKDEVVRLEDAPAYFTEYLQLHPDDAAWAYSGRGTAWIGKKEYENAIKDYTEAIRLRPNDATIYNNRGWAFARAGDDEKAQSDYTEAIRIDPKFAMAYYNRSIVWEHKKDYDKAIADSNESTRLDPTRARFVVTRGVQFREKGEYAKAIRDSIEAIRLDPLYGGPGGSYNALAWLLATCPEERFRDGKRAVDLATKACELTRWSDAYSVGTLGAASAEAGDFEAAIKWQTKAMQLNPRDEEFRKGAEERLALYREKKAYRDQPSK
jgi:tetratricopeptide (TPR) repeat protein